MEKEYRKPGFSLIIVYGRRRIGKTRLLSEWIRDKRGIYYIASQLSYKQLSEEFSTLIGRELGIWTPNDIVEAIVRIAVDKRNNRIVVVLDEFQYIVEADPSIVSRLQKAIDTILTNTSVKLVLSGSAVSFFEKQLLGYKSPLFGRRTSSIKLKPIRFPQALGFFNKMSIEDSIKGYSILGGTPAYLKYAYNKENIDELLYEILSPGSYLLTEAEDFLRQEVREPRTYMAILKALADGYNRSSEIANIIGVDPRTMNHYIGILRELEIIAYRRPLGFKKKSRLYFTDNYFHFWFKYIIRNRGLVEAGYVKEAVEAVKETLDQYVAKVFELIVEQTIPELYHMGILKTKPVEAGKWWHRGLEIDIIVRDPGKSTTFIEVKWSNLSRSSIRGIINKLEEKASHTGLVAPINYYVVIAKAVGGSEDAIIEVDENKYTVDFMKAIEKLESK